MKVEYDIDGIIETHEVRELPPLVSSVEYSDEWEAEDIVFTPKGAFYMVVVSFFAGIFFSLIVQTVVGALI